MNATELENPLKSLAMSQTVAPVSSADHLAALQLSNSFVAVGYVNSFTSNSNCNANANSENISKSDLHCYQLQLQPEQLYSTKIKENEAYYSSIVETQNLKCKLRTNKHSPTYYKPY